MVAQPVGMVVPLMMADVPPCRLPTILSAGRLLLECVPLIAALASCNWLIGWFVGRTGHSVEYGLSCVEYICVVCCVTIHTAVAAMIVHGDICLYMVMCVICCMTLPSMPALQCCAEAHLVHPHR